MPEQPEDPLEPYRQLTGTARDRLGTDTKIELVLAREWGGDPRGDQFTIYAPPHRPDQEHILLHYLATFHMIEQGWRSPVFQYDTDFQYRVANRAADTFTDYWAYRLVADQFGPDHIHDYPAWLLDLSPQEAAERLQADQETFDFSDDQFATYCYVFTVDWYSMVPALTRPHEPSRADDLIHHGEQLVAALEREQVLDRLATIRTIFADYNEQDAFTDVLPDQEEQFRQYYATVWPDNPPATVTDMVDPRHA